MFPNDPLGSSRYTIYTYTEITWPQAAAYNPVTCTQRLRTPLRVSYSADSETGQRRDRPPHWHVRCYTLRSGPWIS